MKIKQVRTSIQLYSGHSEKLQVIALELGYVQTRGVGTGKVGNISKLIRAIADGEIKIKYVA